MFFNSSALSQSVLFPTVSYLYPLCMTVNAHEPTPRQPVPAQRFQLTKVIKNIVSLRSAPLKYGNKPFFSASRATHTAEGDALKFASLSGISQFCELDYLIDCG